MSIIHLLKASTSPFSHTKYYLLVTEIWKPPLQNPCQRSCPSARNRACGGWGMRGAFGGCDSHNPSLYHQRTRNDDPQLSKGRFEQLHERLFGKWPLIEASNVLFETGRRPFHFSRHFLIPTKNKNLTLCNSALILKSYGKNPLPVYILGALLHTTS